MEKISKISVFRSKFIKITVRVTSRVHVTLTSTTQGSVSEPAMQPKTTKKLDDKGGVVLGP